MVALFFGRLCLSGFRLSLPKKPTLANRVALLRSIPHQGSQLLSALQVLCEELSCEYLALVPHHPMPGARGRILSKYAYSSSLPHRVHRVLSQFAIVEPVYLLVAEAV
jgi:hypothetical protein